MAARFGSGEVRKAIVISLTVIYIIMLSSYFYNVSLPLGGNLSKPLSNSSELVSLPVTSQLQNNNSPENPSISSAALNNNSPESPSIPSAALKDITTNFFWVYAVIIVFYFGSRAWESVTEAKMVKDLKDEPPLDLAQKRLALGMLSPENYDDISEKLRANEEGAVILVDVTPVENKDSTQEPKFYLIVKNSGDEDRTVDKYWVNDVSTDTKPAKVPARKYITILVDVPEKEKAKTEYVFRITPDKGKESSKKYPKD